MMEKLALAEAEVSAFHKATICAVDLTNVRG
jgi:hypothetical protein